LVDVCTVDGTAVLERDEEDVARERIGVEVEEVADSLDFVDRLQLPAVVM
jgi:hypothetical protein